MVCSDRGVENSKMAECHIAFRLFHSNNNAGHKSYRYGTSHNSVGIQSIIGIKSNLVIRRELSSGGRNYKPRKRTGGLNIFESVLHDLTNIMLAYNTS